MLLTRMTTLVGLWDGGVCVCVWGGGGCFFFFYKTFSSFLLYPSETTGQIFLKLVWNVLLVTLLCKPEVSSSQSTNMAVMHFGFFLYSISITSGNISSKLCLWSPLNP